MVRELHSLGFERLRAYTYLSHYGHWYCCIVPAAWVERDRPITPQSLLHEIERRYKQVIPSPHSIIFYYDKEEQQVFHNPTTVFLTPRELAHQFVRERPAIAALGFGPDPEYVAWYSRTLEMLAPNGIFYLFGEHEGPAGHLYTRLSRISQVPLPTTGQMDRAEWDGFLARLQTSHSV